MSKLPPDPFGRCALPSSAADQQQRVRWAREVGQALVEGRMPSREAALYFGGATCGWLAEGGDLVRDFLRIAAKPGSHRTPQWLAARLEEDDEDEGEGVED